MSRISKDGSEWSLFMKALIELSGHHSPDSKPYKLLNGWAQEMALETFGEGKPQAASIDELGIIKMPYLSMGAINSTHLFGLDELIIFAFYMNNARRYRTAADIGANIGLHSVVMARCGWQVESYEPDPFHAEIFLQNISRNALSNSITLHQSAVSSKKGKMDFVRVLGHTTGSHLAGAKNNPYGELETFSVEVESINEIIGKVDFAKLDIEGQEAVALCTTARCQWEKTDAIVEIGSRENAEKIFNHLDEIGVNMFPQQINWQKAQSSAQIPTSYREGSLFISFQDKMPWIAHKN